MDEAIRKVAEAFVEDYITVRISQGATNAEIKAEIEHFWSKYVA